MFDQLGNFMKLGAEIQEARPTRTTITSIPHAQGDRKVPYDLIDHDEGRILRMHTNPPISFRTGELLDERCVRCHRLPDGHPYDAKPAISGHCTIHECSPHHVDATLHHEGKDVRIQMQHDKDGWIMSGMPSRPNPANLGGQFIQSVVKSAATEELNNALAAFGLGPNFQLPEPKLHECPKCGEHKARIREAHADTGMDEMEYRCGGCGESTPCDEIKKASAKKVTHLGSLCLLLQGWRFHNQREQAEMSQIAQLNIDLMVFHS